MNPPLVVTKYMLPPARPQRVARTQLLERLLATLDRKLTLITAPAGFGKSTLAAEMARASGRDAAWFSLDAGDNDPVRWGAYLAASVRRISPPASAQMEALLRHSGQPPLEALIAALINGVAGVASPLLLVMDDYHVIQSEEIHEAVALLLDRLPPNLHVVIATRSRPPLPLPRLKARGELSEITASELRFTVDEAAAFLRQVMGLDLPDSGVAALTARTEGWITGLQLAALSLHGASNPETAIAGFSGQNPGLLEYLVDEVVQHQPEDIKRFLLQTSILTQLSGPLCDAVTENPGGQRTLQALERANLFLFPLDPERHWYRYHPLFAEFLRTRLHDLVGETGVAALHQRAARWYHENGQPAEAIEHLLTAGAFTAAADLIEEGFTDLGAQTPLVTLRRWLDRLPPQVIRERPRLGVMAAWSLIATGAVQAERYFDQAVDLLDLAAQALRRADQADEMNRESLGLVAAVRTALATWAPLCQLPVCMMQDAALAEHFGKEARRLLPETSLYWRSVVNASLGSVYVRANNVTAAARAFGEAARLGSRSGNLITTLTALQRHAQLMLLLGRLSAADDAYREALHLAAGAGAGSTPALAPICLGRARVLYEWDDLEGAARYVTEALDRYAAGGRPAPEAFLTLARIHQARGETESARACLDQAADLLGTGPKLRAAEAAAWPDGVRVLLAQGDIAGARRWLEAGKMTPDREPSLWRAPEYLALAQVMVAEGESEIALPMVRTLRKQAATSGCQGLEAECLVAEALALHAAHDRQAALLCIQTALELTWAEGYIRLFADGGRPIAGLLPQANNGKLPAARRVYLERLLSILGGNAYIRSQSPSAPALPEPLTEREREVLQLIAVGRTNQDVARELFMGVSTVKWHLLNIYGKLQVRNRTEAVARARSLGLV